MLHFDSDYLEGAHPAIIKRLVATNLDQTSGYGTDEVCERARERIREWPTKSCALGKASCAPRPGTSPPMRPAPWRRAGERRYH